MALATAGGKLYIVCIVYSCVSYLPCLSVPNHQSAPMLIPVHNNIPRCYRFSFVRPVIYRTLDSYNQQSTFLDSVAADEDVKIPQPQLTER